MKAEENMSETLNPTKIVIEPEKTKDDSEIITRAIKEMEEEGTLYKANGKPNIPLLMEKTGLTRQRARSLAKKDFKNVPHGNIGKEREA